MKQSLGLVEVRGMTAALTVADAMCKTANVQIHKLEKTRGGGWMLVMILGDVQAVKVAVDAGASVAQAMKCYIGQTVIARLSDGLLDTISPVIKEVVEEVLLEEAETSETVDVVEENLVMPLVAPEEIQESPAENNGDDITLGAENEEVVTDQSLMHEETAIVDQVVSDNKKRPRKTKKAKRKS